MGARRAAHGDERAAGGGGLLPRTRGSRRRSPFPRSPRRPGAPTSSTATPLLPLLDAGEEARAARLRRRLRATQRRAQPPLQHRRRSRRRSPPQAPELLPRAARRRTRSASNGLPPEKDVLGQPVEIGGYRVYRRSLSQEEYEAPLTATPVPGTSFVDSDGALRRPARLHGARDAREEPEGRGPARRRSRRRCRATSIPRRRRRASTRSRRPISCGCSGTPSTRRTWRATSSSASEGRRAARAADEGAHPRPVLHGRNARGRASATRYTVRSVDRAGNRERPVPGGRRRAVLSPGSRRSSG